MKTKKNKNKNYSNTSKYTLNAGIEMFSGCF